MKMSLSKIALAAALILLPSLASSATADAEKSVGVSLGVFRYASGEDFVLPLVNGSFGWRHKRVGIGIEGNSLGVHNEIIPHVKAYDIFGAGSTRVNIAARAGVFLNFHGGTLYGAAAELERGRYVFKASTDLQFTSPAGSFRPGDHDVLAGRLTLGVKL